MWKIPLAMLVPRKYKYLKNKGKYKCGLNCYQTMALQDIDVYSLQRHQRYKFKMNRVVSQGIDFLWDVDLADVSALSKENDNT